MTPVETRQLATFLASVYPWVRMRERPASRNWQARLAATDATDALIAVIRLSRRQRDVAVGDIHAEAHRLREKRLTGHPQPSADPGGPHHFRTQLPAVVAAMLALRVPCPWCGADRGQPCTLPGTDTPLKRVLAHPARLIAVGVTGEQYRGSKMTGPPEVTADV